MSDPVVLLSTGDVVGPAGGVTDNSMVLFSGTSGKLIKGNNAVVTAAGLALLDDVDAAAQKVTLGLGNVDNTSDINKPISTATQTALDLKATIASPTFTGTPTAPTASAGTSTTQLATTAFVTTADNLKANINSPTFTGVPSAPTASVGTNTTQLATTAFVAATAVGVGQTWQDVKASRPVGVTYTNTTGRPIMVAIDTSGETVIVDGLQLVASGPYGVQFIVPAGSTYSVPAGGGGIDRWLELR